MLLHYFCKTVDPTGLNILLNIKSHKYLHSSSRRCQENKSKNSRMGTKAKLAFRAKLESQCVNAQIRVVPHTFYSLLNKLSEPIGFDCRKAIESVVTFHDELIINHQPVEGTRRFNDIRLYAIRMLEDSDPEPLSFVATGKKDKWPSALKELRPLYYRVRDKKCRISDQIIRSVLYLNRMCTGNNDPDFSEITAQFVVPGEFRKRYRNFISSLGISNKMELITKPSTRVLASGPNGKPKWQTVDIEAYALFHSKLNTSFRDLCLYTGNTDLYNYMKSVAEKQDRVSRVRLRYLLGIPDKGNKCRVVAISDYWTQVLLEPIMLSVQKFIEERYSNVSSSKDHAAGFTKLVKFIRPGVHSYDVKSWTDAFPSSLQYDFVKEFFNENIAQAWYDLVVKCDWTAKGHTDPIVYGRGQGMGTAGSFDIASAADLLLLEMIYRQDYSYKKIRRDLFNKVGDDLWCYDPKGYIRRTYIEQCGIELSVPKTKTATQANLVGEFVSRSINHGADVSRISANICRAVKKNLLDLPELARHLAERQFQSTIPLKEFFKGNKVPKATCASLIRSLYLLTLLEPERTGSLLLKNSIEADFSDLLADDDVVAALDCPSGIRRLKNTYYFFSGKLLLDSIIEKTERVFDAASEFDSSDELRQKASPELYWLTEDDLPMLTSKLLMAKAFESHNRLYQIEADSEVDKILSDLERIDASMTFRELGVITGPSRPLRPQTSRLYKLTKSLFTLNASTYPLLDDVHHISPEMYVRTSIDVQYSEPYLSGTVQKSVQSVLSTIPHCGKSGH